MQTGWCQILIIDDVWKFIKKIWDYLCDVWDWLKVIYDKMADFTWSTITGLVSSLSEVASNVSSVVGDMVDVLAEIGIGWIEDIWIFLDTYIVSIYEFLDDYIVAIAGTVATIGTKLADFTWSKIATIWDFVTGAAEIVGTWIIAGCGKIWDMINDSGVISDVFDFWLDVLSLIGGVVAHSGVTDILTDVFTWFKNKLVDVFAAGSGFINFTGTLLPTFTGSFNLLDLWNDLMQALENSEADWLLSMVFRGTGIALIQQVGGTIPIPTGVTWFGIEMDIWDAVFAWYWMNLLPITTLNILGFGIPIPWGLLIYIFGRDVDMDILKLLPREDMYFNTRFSDRDKTQAPTFKDWSYDQFLLHKVYPICMKFGIKFAKKVLSVLFSFRIPRTKVDLKDITARLKPEDAEHDYDSEVEVPIWEDVAWIRTRVRSARAI